MIRCSRTFYLVFLCARDGLPNTSNLHRTTATNFPRKLYSQQGIDEDTQSEVARVEKHSIKFLHAVNDLGTVIIVTNASLRWVEDAIEYMPDMRSLLDQYGIEVVSARDDCKRTNPFMYYYNLISPTGWKRRTFCAEVRKYLEANDYEDCDRSQTTSVCCVSGTVSRRRLQPFSLNSTTRAWIRTACAFLSWKSIRVLVRCVISCSISRDVPRSL